LFSKITEPHPIFYKYRKFWLFLPITSELQVSIAEKIKGLNDSLPGGVTLVAVSKTYPPDTIMEAYDAGQRIFGENRPQELKAKYETMPKDIRWHLIGQLQTNKVKYIAPFVELIHSVDSDKLLAAIDKEAVKNNRTIEVLLEIHIAREDSKSGWGDVELREYLNGGTWRRYKNVHIRGLMSIASFTDDRKLIRDEFTNLKALFDEFRDKYFGGDFNILSAGMTSDYDIALECGSNMVRIGSLIFGER